RSLRTTYSPAWGFSSSMISQPGVPSTACSPQMLNSGSSDPWLSWVKTRKAPAARARSNRSRMTGTVPWASGTYSFPSGSTKSRCMSTTISAVVEGSSRTSSARVYSGTSTCMAVPPSEEIGQVCGAQAQPPVEGPQEPLAPPEGSVDAHGIVRRVGARFRVGRIRRLGIDQGEEAQVPGLQRGQVPAQHLGPDLDRPRQPGPALARGPWLVRREGLGGARPQGEEPAPPVPGCQLVLHLQLNGLRQGAPIVTERGHRGPGRHHLLEKAVH